MEDEEEFDWGGFREKRMELLKAECVRDPCSLASQGHSTDSPWPCSSLQAGTGSRSQDDNTG